MKNKSVAIILLAVLASSLAEAATYNISTSWSNIPSPLSPGDVVFVTNIPSGVPSFSGNGSAGNLITIICVDGSVSSGSYTLTNRSYLQFVGINFTGTVTLSNADYCRFIDCTRTGGNYGLIMSPSTVNDGNIIRAMTATGLAPGTNENRYTIFSAVGDNNIFEYCTTSAGGDFVRFFGNWNIARNNYVAGRDAASGNHIDDLQGYENVSGNEDWTINNLFEANLSETNTSGDAHGYIIQDSSATKTLRGGLIRGNIHYKTGRNIGEWNNWPDTYAYNNTFVDCWAVTTTWADFAVYIRGTSSGHVWGNNIFDTCTYNNQGQPFYLTNSGTGTTVFTSLEYLTGNPTGDWIEDTDPQLTDPAGLNFMPASGSAAVAAARYLAQASGSGSASTTLVVDDSRFFTDGWDVVEGDLIKIGAAGSEVRISAIDYDTHTITLAAARSWSDNDGVYVIGWDSDIGALAYRAGGYTIDGTDTLSNSGTSYTVTPDDADLVRMVVFYEDGVPQEPDYDSPYQYTSGGGSVTAKIYARFASQTPVVIAEATEGGSPPEAPTSVAATPASAYAVSITWTASAGATEQRLYRGTVDGGPYGTLVAVLSGTAESASDTTVQPGTTYYYTLTASNADGTSAYATDDDATTPALTESPTAPALFILLETAAP